MKYPFHTTTKVMRDKLFEKEFELIEINIDDFLLPSIAIDEDKNELYQFDYEVMQKTLTEFDERFEEETNTTYFERWHLEKGEAATVLRIRQFRELYESIKKEGLREPIAVEQTGQKLDGSHRCAIMKHLGHKTIPAKLYKLTYEDVDEAFIKRTTEARERIYGKNYYYINYGDFQNINGNVSEVYKENSYERWEVLRDLVKGKVVDIGCNEGFMSIQHALTGKEAIGFEHEYADGANFNKLTFEFLLQKSLPVSFVEADVTKVEIPECDTCLLLNVIYHLPKDKQVPFLQGLKAEQLIFQANLRKAHEADRFRGCTVEGIKELCNQSGWKITKIINWRDKPIVIAE